MSDWFYLSPDQKNDFVSKTVIKPRLAKQLQVLLRSNSEYEYSCSENVAPYEVLQRLIAYVEARVSLYFDSFCEEGYVDVRDRVEEVLGELYAKRKHLVINATRPANNGVRPTVQPVVCYPGMRKKDFWRRADLRDEVVAVSREEYSEVLIVALFAPDPLLLFRVRGFARMETSSEYVRYNASSKPHHLKVFQEIVRHLHRQEHLPLSKPTIVQRARSNYELMRSDLLQQLKVYTEELAGVLPASVSELCAQDDLYRRAVEGLQAEQKAVIARKLALVDELQAEIGGLYTELADLQNLATVAS